MSYYEIPELLELWQFANTGTLKFHQNARTYKIINERDISKFEFHGKNQYDRPRPFEETASRLPSFLRVPHSLHHWAAEHQVEQQSVSIFMQELMQAEAEQLLRDSNLRIARSTHVQPMEMKAAVAGVRSSKDESLFSSSGEGCKGRQNLSFGTRPDTVTTEVHRSPWGEEMKIADMVSLNASAVGGLNSDSDASILNLNFCIKAIRTCISDATSSDVLSNESSGLGSNIQNGPGRFEVLQTHDDNVHLKVQRYYSANPTREVSDEDLARFFSPNSSNTNVDKAALRYRADDVSESCDDLYSTDEEATSGSPILDHNPAWGLKPDRRLRWKDTSPRQTRSKCHRSSSPDIQSLQHNLTGSKHEETWKDIKTEVETRVTLINDWLETLSVDIEELNIDDLQDTQKESKQVTQSTGYQLDNQKQSVCTDVILQKETSVLERLESEAPSLTNDRKSFRLRCSDSRRYLARQNTSISASTSASDSSADKIE